VGKTRLSRHVSKKKWKVSVGSEKKNNKIKRTWRGKPNTGRSWWRRRMIFTNPQ
jgi:hypothetical protein